MHVYLILGTVNTFYNNFEIVKMEFFKSRIVQDFTQYILSNGGVYKYRWGDAALRYIVVSLFASEEELLHASKLRVSYCHACNKKKTYRGAGSAFSKRYEDG